jgi:hypothetical protein
MKNKIVKLVLIAIVSVATQTYAKINASKDSISTEKCLVIKGRAVDGNSESIDGTSVVLYKENEQMEWVEVTSVVHHDHNFMFILEANSYYTIMVSKPGYITRSIAVSTKLPADVSYKPMFRYEFDVVMFKENPKADDYYFDFPVAIISYDAEKEVFYNNEKYTKNLKLKIKESNKQAKITSKGTKKAVAKK